MISVIVNTRQFSDQMSEFERDQLPFATKNALNATALDFQKVEQDRIAASFILRRPEFILRTVKIERDDWATKQKLEATVRIDPKRDVLAKFEAGGVKESITGGSVAIPIEAKTNKRDIITPANRPKAFQLVTTSTKSGRLVAKGLKRTFLIEGADGKGEIFQRVGRGKNSRLKLLYDLEKKVPIPKALDFVKTATDVINDRFPQNFKTAFDDAMRTAW